MISLAFRGDSVAQAPLAPQGIDLAGGGPDVHALLPAPYEW